MTNVLISVAKSSIAKQTTAGTKIRMTMKNTTKMTILMTILRETDIEDFILVLNLYN